MHKLSITQKELLEEPIATLELSVRWGNILEAQGIEKVVDLLKKTPEELLAIPNFGRQALEEVYAKLASHGFKRKKPRKRRTQINEQRRRRNG